MKPVEVFDDAFVVRGAAIEIHERKESDASNIAEPALSEGSDSLRARDRRSTDSLMRARDRALFESSESSDDELCEMDSALEHVRNEDVELMLRQWTLDPTDRFLVDGFLRSDMVPRGDVPSDISELIASYYEKKVRDWTSLKKRLDQITWERGMFFASSIMCKYNKHELRVDT